MWPPRGFSGNGASIYVQGMTMGCPRKKPGGQEVAVAVRFSTKAPLKIQSSATEQ